MAALYKILILGVGFALSCNLWAQSQRNFMQTETSPLKIERDALGAVYYWIDNNALDLARIDYSINRQINLDMKLTDNDRK